MLAEEVPQAARADLAHRPVDNAEKNERVLTTAGDAAVIAGRCGPARGLQAHYGAARHRPQRGRAPAMVDHRDEPPAGQPWRLTAQDDDRPSAPANPSVH